MAENKENNSTSKDGCGEVESQDKKDMGFGTHPGGGFTLVISILPLKKTTTGTKVYCR